MSPNGRPYFKRVKFSDESIFIVEYILGIEFTEKAKFIPVLKKVLKILPHERPFSEDLLDMNYLVQHIFETYQTLDLSKLTKSQALPY